MSPRTAVAKPPAVRRRHGGRREKTSLSIRTDVLDAAREIVEAGAAENLSALVEAAIEEKVKRTRRVALYDAYAEASRDRAFMKDMDAVSKSFSATSKDGL